MFVGLVLCVLEPTVRLLGARVGSQSLSPSLLMTSCLSKRQTMCRQRASIRALLVLVVGEQADRYQEPRLDSLAALFHFVEALSSLAVVLLLAARSAVRLCACPLMKSRCRSVWPFHQPARVLPVLRAAGCPWAAGPLSAVALSHCGSATAQILSRWLRPRFCDHVSSVARALRGQVQHRDLALRGSTRRLSI